MEKKYEENIKTFEKDFNDKCVETPHYY